MYYSQSNQYINGQSPLKQRENSSYLQKIGESTLYNQEYASYINRNTKTKQEYGDILRSQMQEKLDQKSISNNNQPSTYFINNNNSNFYNNNNNNLQHTQLNQIRNQQQSSDIFHTGNLITYQQAHPNNNNNNNNNNLYKNHSFINQNYNNNQNVQDYERRREEYAKNSELYWSQPKNYRGSLLKEYYNESYFEEKEKKQRAFAQALADQINEKKLSQKYSERPKEINYLTSNEVFEKNKSNILDSIIKINQPSSNKNNNDVFRIQLDPTNSKNRGYYQSDQNRQSENGYRWQPGGEWSRGKADFDVLKGLYRKEQEVFERQMNDLKQTADAAQQKRDNQYVEMVIMRDKIQHNDKVRALNLNHQFLDSTNPNNINNQDPRSYLQNKNGLLPQMKELPYVQPEKYDHIYFKHNYELPSQSSLLNPNYIQKKFQSKNKNNKNGQQGQEQDIVDDPQLEEMLDNFYKEELYDNNQEEADDYDYDGGKNNNINNNKRKRRNSMDAKVNLSKIKQKSVQNLNQSQFTEYNILNQIEEEELKNNNNNNNINEMSNQLNQSQPLQEEFSYDHNINESIQKQHKKDKQNQEIKKSTLNDNDNEKQQDDEDNLMSNVQDKDKRQKSGKKNKNNSKLEEINNLDISEIESKEDKEQELIKPNNNNNMNKQNNVKQNKQEYNNNLNDISQDESISVNIQKRPFSAYNKRKEVLSQLQNHSEFISYRKIKEKSIYDKQINQQQQLQQNKQHYLIDYNRINRMQEQQQDISYEGEQYEKLNKSIHDDQAIDKILGDIGGLIQDIHIKSDYNNNNIKIDQNELDKQNQLNQFQKYQNIQKLHSVNAYNHGQDNPYLNDVYKNNKGLSQNINANSNNNYNNNNNFNGENNRVYLENNQQNKQFLQSSNHIDFLIGQLVQDRNIY